MLSDFQDDPRAFWKGLVLAVALGTAAWCSGLAMGAMVSWWMGR